LSQALKLVLFGFGMELRLTRGKLQSEDSQDEPQKRLNVILNTILDESTLRAELEDCGLEIMGIKEDLALWLLQYAREHPEEFLEPSPQPELDN
jgi:hypothetical protein